MNENQIMEWECCVLMTVRVLGNAAKKKATRRLGCSPHSRCPAKSWPISWPCPAVGRFFAHHLDIQAAVRSVSKDTSRSRAPLRFHFPLSGLTSRNRYEAVLSEKKESNQESHHFRLADCNLTPFRYDNLRQLWRSPCVMFCISTLAR